MGLPIYLRGLQDNPDRAVLTLNQLLAKACVALKFVLSKVMADMVDEPNWITLYPMAKADATIEMEPTGLGIAKMATSSANVVTETSGAVATEVSHAATDVSHTLTATKTADATPTPAEVEATRQWSACGRFRSGPIIPKTTATPRPLTTPWAWRTTRGSACARCSRSRLHVRGVAPPELQK